MSSGRPFTLCATWNQGWWIIVSAALVILGVLRTNALRVQDRLIKLEEQVRYDGLLRRIWRDGPQHCQSINDRIAVCVMLSWVALREVLNGV